MHHVDAHTLACFRIRDGRPNGKIWSFVAIEEDGVVFEKWHGRTRSRRKVSFATLERLLAGAAVPVVFGRTATTFFGDTSQRDREQAREQARALERSTLEEGREQALRHPTYEALCANLEAILRTNVPAGEWPPERYGVLAKLLGEALLSPAETTWQLFATSVLNNANPHCRTAVAQALGLSFPRSASNRALAALVSPVRQSLLGPTFSDVAGPPPPARPKELTRRS